MRVITYGTFDTFHYGHLNLLRRASEYGDLTVALSTDEFNKIKGKTSFHNYGERKANLEMIKCVKEIIPEKNWGQKENDMKIYDIMVMGDDWRDKFDEFKCVYLTRTPNVSSTLIKNAI